MSENRDFGFCPRCGALMQNGVCQSCGYENRSQAMGPGMGQQQNPGWNQQQNPGWNQPRNPQGYPGYPQVYVGPQKQRNNKKGVWLAVTAAVVLVLGLILAMIFYFHSIMKVGMEAIEQMPDAGLGDDYDYFDDDYDYGYDYGYGYYEPDENDPYYETITDATRTDLEYGIDWVSVSIDPDDSGDSCSYYSIYPILRDKEDEHKFDAANAAIRTAAEKYQDTYRDYAGGCTSYGYVTFMDEEKVSVVFKHEQYEDNGRRPLLDALSFRVDTGEPISHEEMVELDADLALRFRAQDKTQNDGVEYVQELTDEELLEILKDPETAVMFYTPVGLEIGFNYENGWVTVTMKNRAL